jgi:ZIP family zinc transporter
MSTGQVLLLGAIAGFTIFLGLPLAKIRSLTATMRVFLSSIATGVLIFLFWDVVSHAVEPIEGAITDKHWDRFGALAAILVVGVSLGLLTLVFYERWMNQRRAQRAAEASAGAVASTGLSPAANLSLLIAIGIGLHNFSEGLAIGQSAAADEIGLALSLIIGFGLHNATEGFGIVGPLAGEAERPSWGFLFVLGLIGGGPTFLGTVIGQTWVNDYVAVAFLALAAGSILFVINELVHMNYAAKIKDMVSYGILIGLFAGFATDWILVASGA